jgi:hypothetical protein
MAKTAIRGIAALIAILGAVFTFTSCSGEFAEPNLPPVPETVEVPVEIECEFANWQTPTHLYVGTSSYSSWVLSAGNLQFAEPIIELAAERQGSVTFGQPYLNLVNSNDNTDTYTYQVNGTDGQVITDTIKVKRGLDCHISDLKVTLTVNTRSAKFGIAQATEIVVTKTVEFDLTLADGRSEHLVHNTSKSYVQSEVPVKVQVETHVDSVFVTVRDTITNEIHVVDTLYQTIKEIEYVYVEVHDTTVVEREVEKWMHDSIPVIVHDTVTVVKTDTITNTVIEVKTDSVFVTVVEEHEVIVRDTVYLEKYIYLAGERINQKSKVGYATAEVKVGNESILNANLTLAQRFINVELEDLCKVEGSGNFSGCTLSDGQVGTLTYSTNGCTVDDVKWDLVVNQLSDIDCEIEVICTLYCSRTNERGEVMYFEVVMEPAYYHLSALPEPAVEVSYSVIATPYLEEEEQTLYVKLEVAASDGSYSDQIFFSAAQWALPKSFKKNSGNLYVSSATASSQTNSHDPEKVDPTTKGNWTISTAKNWTTMETLYPTTNSGNVSLKNRFVLMTSSVETTLPNGKKLVLTTSGETISNISTVNNGLADHYCEQEMSNALYQFTEVQYAEHHLSFSLTMNGETQPLDLEGLTKDGKVTIAKGQGEVNIFLVGQE